MLIGDVSFVLYRSRKLTPPLLRSLAANPDAASALVPRAPATAVKRELTAFSLAWSSSSLNLNF